VTAPLPGLARLRFDADGLVPAIAQDAASGRVLMLAWANREAVERTIATGVAHFWSRRRAALWRKGATSGNVLAVERIEADCDGDALLLSVRPRGAACHTGAASCFDGGGIGRAAPARLDLAALERIVEERAAGDPATSYTARLLAEGRNRIAQKVGEEAIEVVVAALAGAGASHGSTAVVAEAADLLYHLAVLLRVSGTRVAAVEEELARRHRRG
jgi:phosphoribosyl-ATP pyrophosphohydrolase/phosphoribosyl-AMP cyclohydrolase